MMSLPAHLAATSRSGILAPIYGKGHRRNNIRTTSAWMTGRY